MVFGLIVGTIYLFLDIFYWLKWTASVLTFRIKEKIHRKRFDLYDFDAKNEPEKMGVLVPKVEKRIESPLSEDQLQKVADEVLFYGVNSKAEVMMVRILRDLNDMAEAWVYLKLADGRWFELEKTIGFQRNFGGKCTSFMCDGLQMFPLSAMRRWRISYCGMLREMKSSKETENKSVFVKFSFIWTASSDVYDASSDINIKSASRSMARAKWNSFIPPVNKVADALDFYCQTGVLNGIVSIEDESDKEMYMFGEKIRYVGKRNYLEGCKVKHIIGAVPESGLILHLAKASIPNIVHNMYFGFLLHTNSVLYPIEDGVIVSNLTGSDIQGKNLTAVLKTKKHEFELLGNFVCDGIHFSSGKVWGESKFEFTEIEFDIDDFRGRGFMITAEISKLPTVKIQKTPSFIHSGQSFARPRTVYFTEEASHSTDLTGGKGSSLGKLTKLKREMKSDFIVPRGIVVTTVAYEEFLTCEIMEKIENLKNIVYGNVKGSVHEACKIVALTIERSYLPDKVTKEIEDKLNNLFGGKINNHRFAVRSSATGEDTDQMSAAGQMETFLGVQGLKEIITAVKKCWASQFGFIAVEYKRQNGQILNSPMAVVIQEMVKCESAGVLFTCDPVTNNPSVTVITGNYGLGESVVSGSEEPDTVVLAKLPNDEMEIKDVIVGLKHHKIIMKDDKNSGDVGTVTEDVSEEEKNKCCISAKMAMKLGKLSMMIEHYFKSPRDIEWGIKDDDIYILQSRPITTSTAVTDYEIKHEFDVPLQCEKEFYTKSNVGEVMPNATSPLGIDVLIKQFSINFQMKSMKLKQRNTFMKAKYFPTGLGPFYNQMMMSVADLVARSEDPGHIENQGWMIAIFGRVLDDPELFTLIKRRQYEPIKKSLLFYFEFLKTMFFASRGRKALTEKLFDCQIPAENGRTSKETFNLLVNCCSDTAEPFEHHMTCTEASSLWNAYLMSILGSSKGIGQNEVYNAFSKLVATLSDVESADVPSAMQDLAESIVKDMKGEDFRAMTVEKALEWLQTSTSLAGFKYRQFMKRHGHRCLKEFDVHSTTWGEDPKPLIKLLQNMSTLCENGKKKKQEDSGNASPEVSVPLNLKSRFLLKLTLPFCRRGVRDREAAKSLLIKSIDNLRKGYNHLSKAMVAEGYLPDSDLLFFMTIDEISDLLETRNPRLIARANQRRRLFPILDAYIFPEISKGLPVPINEKQDEEIEYVADLTMKGIPVSQGCIKGYARVAMSLEEASHLKPGEILITYSTDIGWSPYFPILSGVVTELGGLISHGAVVSREYGLPCVVGLHGATRQFRTGDYVFLDGNKGILQRISPPEK